MKIRISQTCRRRLRPIPAVLAVALVGVTVAAPSAAAGTTSGASGRETVVGAGSATACPWMNTGHRPTSGRVS